MDLGVECAGTVEIPVEFLVAHHKNASKGETQRSLRIFFGVEESQSGPPGTTEEVPPVDTQMLAHPLVIFYQYVGSITLDEGTGIPADGESLGWRERCRPLVVGDDTEPAGIEISEVDFIATGAGAAVQIDHRDSIGIAVLEVGQTMTVAHLQLA